MGIEIILYTLALGIGILTGIFVTLYILKDLKIEIEEKVAKEQLEIINWLSQYLNIKKDISNEQYQEIMNDFKTYINYKNKTENKTE